MYSAITDNKKTSEAQKPGRLRHNIVALGMVQAANYLIPLVTLPYLTRVLGVAAYGKVAFAQVLMAYFVLITDYGFSWSATRKIAAHRNDKEYVSRVFVSTWAAQWALLIVATAIAIPIVGLIGRLQADAALYAVAFTIVLGNACFPVWLLQGLERLREVAAIQIGTRLLGLIPLFILVRTPTDKDLVLAIQGGSAIIAGLFSIAWITRKQLVIWRRPDLRLGIQELKEGLPLFGSRLAISLYTTLVPLILGAVAGPVALGYFSLADKLRSAAQSMLSPLSQALYPRMSHLFANDPKSASALIKRSAVLVTCIAGSISIALWGLADWLIVLLAGAQYAAAAQVLRWLAFVPLAIGLSNLLGVQIMLPRQLNRAFNTILTAAAVISVAIIWPMISINSAAGAAQTVLIVEIFVTVTMAAYLSRKELIRKSE